MAGEGIDRSVMTRSKWTLVLGFFLFIIGVGITGARIYPGVVPMIMGIVICVTSVKQIKAEQMMQQAMAQRQQGVVATQPNQAAFVYTQTHATPVGGFTQQPGMGGVYPPMQPGYPAAGIPPSGVVFPTGMDLGQPPPYQPPQYTLGSGGSGQQGGSSSEPLPPPPAYDDVVNKPN